MSRTRIVIFAKPPLPGRAKTRLAATLGPARAAALAAAFLADTVALATSLGVEVWISTPEPEHPVLRACTGQAHHLQQGDGDLGARVERSLRAALVGAAHAVALGADSPGLSAEMLRAVWEGLARHDAVLAPAQDGGFWALGLNACPEGLLAPPLPWSSEHTAEAVRQRLFDRGLSVGEGASWFDVDVEDDLLRLREVLGRYPERAPRTAALLG